MNIGRRLVGSAIVIGVVGACGGLVSRDPLPIGPDSDAATGGERSSARPGDESGGSGPTTAGGTESGGGEAGVGPVETGGTAGSGFPFGAAGAAGSPTCGVTIDDMEDGTGHICRGANRDGVWYAFNDGDGTQWPAPTTPGIPIETSVVPGGRGQSQRAVHTYGSANQWAGIGLDLAFDGTSYDVYDASAYDGITFWARGDSCIDARIGTVPTTSTQWGGTCTLDTPPVGEGCVPHFSYIMLSDDWMQYWVPFDRLSDALEGDQTRVEFGPSELTNVQFRVGGGAFDFWIDDIAFFVGLPDCCSPRPLGCEGADLFPDPDLKSAVGPGDLICEDVCLLQVLRASAPTPPGGIRDLQGLQCLLDLRWLDLSGNQVADLDPVAGLIRLSILTLSQNLITSVEPLRNLARLLALDLSHNQISDLGPLGGLSALAGLNGADNRVSEIGPLGGLTELNRLDLSQNQIVDIGPLRSLTQLQKLDLSDNQIREVSALGTLVRLQELELSKNQIENIGPLGALDQLLTLDLADNQIQDVSGLSGLGALNTLNLAGNQIAAILPPFALPSLSSLDLSRNLLEDATGLSDLPDLSSLDLSDNQIADIGFLSGLGSYSLSLSHNRIRDLGPLSGLGEVTNLYLSDNQISDLEPLSGWTGAAKLVELDLANNGIAQLPSLGSLAALSTLDLSGNQIVDVSPLADLPALFTLRLGANQITDLAPLLGFSGLNQRSHMGVQNPTVDLSDNPIDCEEQAANIAALRNKPVTLTIDCP